MTKTMTILLSVCLAIVTLLYLHKSQSVDSLNARVESNEEQIRLLTELLVERSRSRPVPAVRISYGMAQADEAVVRKTLTVTAYSPTEEECDSYPFITASNRKVREGIVAVSRDLFNQGWIFGKKVYIRDHGIFIIDDLMGSQKRQCVDIFMFDTGMALEFGKRKLDVYLLDL